MFFKINILRDIVDIRVKAPHPKLVKEAIRIVKLLPKMKPGQDNGVIYSKLMEILRIF